MSSAPAPVVAPAQDNKVLTQGQSYTDPAGRTGTVNFDTKTGQKLNPGQTTNSNPSASLIVTSGASRANYGNNVNTINTANNNLKTVQAGQTASGIAASLGMTPEKFLSLNPDYAAKGNLVGGQNKDYKGLTGLIQPGQTYKVGPDGTPTQVTNPDGSTTDGSKTSTTGKDGSISTVDSSDGTTTKTDKDGNTVITTSNGAVLDPSLKKQFDDNIAAMTDAAANAKTVLDKATATLSDDPAAIQAASDIKSQYDVLIKQMQDKNAMILGGIAKNSARTGMMQYANEMDGNFKSMELDKSVQRIADLVTKENMAIAKSNAAYKAGDVKAFDSATKNYESALKDKQKSILDLNKAINDQVKQNAADLRSQRLAIASQTTNDVKLSTALATSMADVIAKSGVTDEAKIDAYIQTMAANNGISNPEVLRSALLKAQGTATTTALKNKNTQSIIDKRGTGGGGNGKNPKFVISDQIKQVSPLMEKAKGPDNYIDPAIWVAARSHWNELGGTDASFNTTFKKYLNPASYTKAGFKAPAKKGS